MKGQRGDEWRDERGVQHREEEIVAVAASEERSRLCRPHSLHDEEHSDDRHGQGADHDHTKTRQRTGKVGSAPTGCPTDPDQDTAAAAIEKAGRYTRDETADLS